MNLCEVCKIHDKELVYSKQHKLFCHVSCVIDQQVLWSSVGDSIGILRIDSEFKGEM